MRIEFPNSPREDFRWTQVLLRIGSAPDNDLVVAAHQAAAHHLRIQQDRRGWVLQVMPSCGRVYVNARPVRERALLRPGDALSVGDCRMLLCADESPLERDPSSFHGPGNCTVALRAVAGPLSGRVLPLHDRLELGPQGSQPLELPQGESGTLKLFWLDGRLRLETDPSTGHPLRLNGVVVREAALQPGDQLGIGMHRFVVDAPGLVPTPAIAVPAPAPEHLPEEAAGPRGEVWWLIATAAVLALGIALMLLVRF
ncbi:forkhead-associated protein [Frateuria sp. Soil773]|uniref:FHA domain-containing protein n=1 Tax=Frateuria sp. Soil773 TaxID=1736407 RepID=UPI0006F73D5C|nr:FHA domain-containing protein [Frateuria sp. Soil773]KRE89177.1 forkhead-associated protein [Frateuria sp. Soil773]